MTRVFSVPGDFTLPLMRDMEAAAGPRLPFVLGLNELNAGYTADAYARVKGFSVLMVTFSVGSLSAMNAIAGMYCEHVPCLVLVGAPNSNSSTDGEIVHHTLGEVRYDYSRAMAAHITVKAATCSRSADFPALLAESVEACLRHRQPVYLEVASNLSSEPVLSPGASPTPLPPLPSLRSLFEIDRLSDPETLTGAVNAAVEILNGASRPLVLGGGHLRFLKFGSTHHPQNEGATPAVPLQPLLSLLDRSGFPYAAMMDAKAIVSESHPSNVGIYAGGISILPGHPNGGGLTRSIVENADAVLLVGCIQSDYATAGHTLKLPDIAHQVEIHPEYVKVGGQAYHRVLMRDFLHHLVSSSRLKANRPVVDDFHQRLRALDKEAGVLTPEVEKAVAERAKKYPLDLTPSAALTIRNVHHHLQRFFTDNNLGPTTPMASPQPPAHVLVDCGDSWMTGMKLRLPAHGSFAIQLQYGSLGWGIPAALGYSQGLKDCGRKGRLVVIQGDGGLQMSAQEMSALLRYQASVIVLVMANTTYLVENEIVPGDFNDLFPWDHVALAKAFAGRQPTAALYAVRATTNEELQAALAEALKRDGLCVVEVAIARDDCNVELTQWAMSLHPSASRPPRA